MKLEMQIIGQQEDVNNSIHQSVPTFEYYSSKVRADKMGSRQKKFVIGKLNLVKSGQVPLHLYFNRLMLGRYIYMYAGQ